MTSRIAKFTLVAVAALAFGGAAQAADITVTVRTGDHGSYQRTADYDRPGDFDDDRRRERSEYRDYREDRREERFYGRPVPA